MQEKETLFAGERQAQILLLLQKNRKVLVRELCELLSVSAVTIRNDLRELEGRGKLLRTHGGAIPCSHTGFEENSAQKFKQNTEEKQAIAREAAKYVQDGDTIALDTGTTSYALAWELLSKERLTVVTNDLKIALLFEEHSDATVILLGGLLRRGYHCTVGSNSEQTMAKIFVDKCFMATNGLTALGGATTPNAEQAAIKQTMLSHGNQVILIAHGDKIGRNSLFCFAKPEQIQLLITDESANPNELNAMREHGVEIRCVSASEKNDK